MMYSFCKSAMVKVFVVFFLYFGLVIDADPVLPKGVPSSTGHCSFSSPEISFVWNAFQDSKGSYYEIQPLEEKQYIKPVIPPNQYYTLPQAFVDNRYTHPEEGHHPYLNHSSFQNKYIESYQDLAQRQSFLDDLLNISITKMPRRMIVFEDVITNNYGLIVRPKSCEYLRNGGCTYMRHNRIYNMHGEPMPHDLVLSLTAGAFGTWHFPMEVFVGLAGLPKEYLGKTMFHVPATTPYILEWFKLLNISHDRVTSQPVIRAKQLLVPQQGRCCEMYETQIEWLRQEIAHLPTKHVSHQHEIILIQRGQSRQVGNVNEVHVAVKKFAESHGYQLILHDDHHLPSLAEQIQRFARAPIVIAPHGAGMLFTAFSPDNACILEFMPMINPECYARIAYIRRLNYAMYMMDGTRMKIDDVNNGLKKCVELIEEKH